MSNEVLILGVKGSGKTVFLSVLGHRYEGVGEFGLSLTPDRTTWNFAYEYYHTMAPEDGSEQRFPKATDPKDDPVPLTWMVRAGTEPLFRMTTLECAGETMVKAFGGEGDEEAEARFSEEMTAAFDAIDAGSAAGIASKADTVTKLRAMAKRASVVCLFLNPRDFESQVAALPGRYRERLGRKLAKLREEGAGMEELRGAREANERALAIARGELKDRYGAMLDLLRTFLENDAYRGKRLVFVLTQTGELERAIEEAGGAWGYLTANIRQLEAHDLAGRAEAIAVSAVNAVRFVEEDDGGELERPDGPIESTGLEDFLLTVGGACSPRLAHLKETRRACLEAERKFTDAKTDGEPLEARWAAAKEWRNAAAAWERAAERFVGELGKVRAAVRQRTMEFAGADVGRADRRWAAEDGMRTRLVEDVASGTVLDAGDLAAWQEVANGAVERKGFEPWTLDDLGLEEGWLADSIRSRRAKWDKIKKLFDDAIECLDWQAALEAVRESELEEYGLVRRNMERQAAEARRLRAEMECRTALEREDEVAATRKLQELAEAEKETGPAESRPVLEEGLACLRARLDVGEALTLARTAFKKMDSGKMGGKDAVGMVAAALPKAAALLTAGEKEHGEENFRDLRQELEVCGRRLQKVVRERTLRKRVAWTAAGATVLALAAAWGALRFRGHRMLVRGRTEAVAMAAEGDFAGARDRLGRLKDVPWLGLKAGNYATAGVFARLAECQEYGEARAELDSAMHTWEERRTAMVRRYGGETRCAELGGSSWSASEGYAQEARRLVPVVEEGEDGLPAPDQDLALPAAQCRAAGKKFGQASQALDQAATAAEHEVENYRTARDALANARAAREARFRDMAELADGEGIRLEPLAEWNAWNTAERAARLAVPDPGTDLPSVGNLQALARKYRDALEAGDANAERALDNLGKTLDAQIAKATVKDEIARMGISDWEAASRAAAAGKLSPQTAPNVKELDAEWERVLRAGKTTSAMVGTRTAWAALGRKLDALAGGPSATDEELAFVRMHKAVCNAAAAYYAEKERRKTLEDRKTSVELAMKKGLWTEASAEAEEQLEGARTAEEHSAAETLRNRVRLGAATAAKEAIGRKTADAATIKSALKSAGHGTATLGDTVVTSVRTAMEEKYPATAPAEFPKTYLRDAQLLEELSNEAKDAVLMNVRNDMVKRVQAWPDQWLERAKRCAAEATDAARSAGTLKSAWELSRECKAALEAVLASDTASAIKKEQAKGVHWTLPALLCIRARNAKSGDALDVRSVKCDGVQQAIVRLAGEGADVAILAAGENNTALKRVTVRPSMGTAKEERVQFKGPGAWEVSVAF